METIAKGLVKLSDTVDDLAIFAREGFDRVDERMVNMDKRFDMIGNEIRDVKFREDSTAYRFELQNLEDRVTHLEKNVEVV